MQSMPAMRAAVIIAAVCFATTLQAEPSAADQQLNTVMEEYGDFTLRESPLTATGAGVSDYNDRLSSVTPESQARRLDKEKLFLAPVLVPVRSGVQLRLRHARRGGRAGDAPQRSDGARTRTPAAPAATRLGS